MHAPPCMHSLAAFHRRRPMGRYKYIHLPDRTRVNITYEYELTLSSRLGGGVSRALMEVTTGPSSVHTTMLSLFQQSSNRSEQKSRAFKLTGHKHICTSQKSERHVDKYKHGRSYVCMNTSIVHLHHRNVEVSAGKHPLKQAIQSRTCRRERGNIDSRQQAVLYPATHQYFCIRQERVSHFSHMSTCTLLRQKDGPAARRRSGTAGLQSGLFIEALDVVCKGMRVGLLPFALSK